MFCRRVVPLLAPLLTLLVPAVCFANPLRLIPKEANLAVVIEKPRKLAETLRDLDAYQSAQALPAVREFLDSTQARRFFQFVAYYERELGESWPNVLDQIAGRGIALGSRVGGDNAPVLLVSEGTDEATVTKFHDLILKVVVEEASRQATGDPKALDSFVRRSTYAGHATAHLGKEFHLARVGTSILFSNDEQALKLGLNLTKPTDESAPSLANHPGPTAAKKLLGGDPLAWLWFNFGEVKQEKAVKDFFEASRKDFIQTMVIGSTVDALRRSDLIAVGLWATEGGFRVALRLPAERAGLPPEFALHVPQAGTPGSLPYLEPKNVVYSQSFYLDLATLWTQRAKLLNEQVRRDIEKAEKQISRVLPGTTFGKLLEMSGPYHRIVVSTLPNPPYSIAPGQVIPPFAIVSTMRDPQFGRSISLALRGAAAIAAIQTGLKMSEESVQGVTIVSYRFPEKDDFPIPDPGNIRFNFVPSFAVVDNAVIVASRPELIRELIPTLQQNENAAKSSSSVWRAQAYGSGTAFAIRTFPDAVVTQTILNDGVGLIEAKKRVDQLAAWLNTIGTLSLKLDHQTKVYEVKIEWKKK